MSRSDTKRPLNHVLQGVTSRGAGQAAARCHPEQNSVRLNPVVLKSCGATIHQARIQT
jgi:hypothetical protein